MLIPPDSASRDLNALANGKANPLIRDDDVSTLREGRDNTRNGGEGLGVDNASCGPQERRHVIFSLQVNILCAVESTGSAGTNSISAECLDCLFLEGLIRIEVVKIEGAKVRNSAAVGQFRFRAYGAADPNFIRQ